MARVCSGVENKVGGIFDVYGLAVTQIQIKIHVNYIIYKLVYMLQKNETVIYCSDRDLFYCFVYFTYNINITFLKLISIISLYFIPRVYGYTTWGYTI
jgi:hypothetical protein